MTLDEAMTDLSIQREAKRQMGESHQADAIQLGIEALKVVKEFRTGRYKTINSPLLGETEE